MHLLKLLVHQFGVHGQWLIQILFSAGWSAARERNLVIKPWSLEHLIATITVLDHAKCLGMLAALIGRCLRHGLGVALSVTFGASS